MTERIFPRWRLALTTLFLLPELLYISQGMTDFFSIALTLVLAPTVWFGCRKRNWFLIVLPAFWLLVLCVLRVSGLLSGLALTALHPALCGLAFTLAATQLARHGAAALYQWAYPAAWTLGLGCAVALLLGWPQAHDLWFLLLLLLAELGRCAALIGLLQ